MAKCHALLGCKNPDLHICLAACREEEWSGAASSTDGWLPCLSQVVTLLGRRHGSTAWFF